MWDDCDSSPKEEKIEEVENLCSMALDEEEQEVNQIKFSDFFELSHDELLEAFHEPMHDSTSLEKRLNNMKSMHKSLNEKYHESSNIISSLKIKNSLLTSKLNKISSNTNDHTEKDSLTNSMKCHLKKLKDEIRSLKSENYILTSRLQNLDDISNNLNILKA